MRIAACTPRAFFDCPRSARCHRDRRCPGSHSEFSPRPGRNGDGRACDHRTSSGHPLSRGKRLNPPRTKRHRSKTCLKRRTRVRLRGLVPPVATLFGLPEWMQFSKEHVHALDPRQLEFGSGRRRDRTDSVSSLVPIPPRTGSAVSAALPVLISALAKHSSSPAGADATAGRVAATRRQRARRSRRLTSAAERRPSTVARRSLGRCWATGRRRCSRRSDKPQDSDCRRPASCSPCSRPSCLAHWDGTLASKVSTAPALPPPSVRRKRKPPRTTLRLAHSSRSSSTPITTAACSTMWRSWRADG